MQRRFPFPVLVWFLVLALFGVAGCGGSGGSSGSSGDIPPPPPPPSEDPPPAAARHTVPMLRERLAAKRPIRVPMAVEVQAAQPAVADVGATSTWRLPFRLSVALSPLDVVKLQVSGGRNNGQAFEAPQVDDPSGGAYLSASTENGSPLEMRANPLSQGLFRIVVPPPGLPAGSMIFAVLGDTSGGGRGIKALKARNPHKLFLLFRTREAASFPNTWGEANERLLIGACTLDLQGLGLHHLRAYVPSQVAPDVSFQVVVRPEDRFNNLSREAPADVAVYLGANELPSTIEPVAGSTSLSARVVLTEEGVHRLRVVDRATGTETVSNPIRCTSQADAGSTFWGVIHGHTEMSDGVGPLDRYFRQMRDELGLDFAASSDHDHTIETSDAMWSLSQELVREWNEPGRFVVFLGYEWGQSTSDGTGHRNVYYLEDDGPLFRTDTASYSTPAGLFQALAPHQAMVIPHQTAVPESYTDWAQHDPNLQRLAEIFQVRGSFEGPEEDDLPAVWIPNRSPNPAGYIRNGLNMGLRLGFTAGGDDHQGSAGTDFAAGSKVVRAGLLGVLAADLTREAVWEALWNRRTIATTGPRVLMDVRLNGSPVGSELRTSADPSLTSRREIRLQYHGTAPVEAVEIVRNGEIVHSEGPVLGPEIDFVWEDTTPLASIALGPTEFARTRFTYYYVRVRQVDGNIAWASPVWIDLDG